MATMKISGVLAFVFLVAQVHADAGTQFSFTCTDNDTTIHITGIPTGFNTYQVQQQDGCSTNTTALNSTTEITIINCNISAPVHLYLMEEKELDFVGGNGTESHALHCSLEHGRLQSVDSKFDNTRPLDETTDYKSVNLTMGITPENVKLGERMTLSITATGQEKYFFCPQSCSAYPSSDCNEEEQVQIFSKDRVIDENIFTGFEYKHQQTATINGTLYAFRFSREGATSSVVYLRCWVNVSDSDCSETTSPTAAPTSPTAAPENSAAATTGPTAATPAAGAAGRRRRRSVGGQHEQREHTVQAYFRVTDPASGEEPSPSSSQSPVKFSPYTVALAVTTAALAVFRK